MTIEETVEFYKEKEATAVAAVTKLKAAVLGHRWWIFGLAVVIALLLLYTAFRPSPAQPAPIVRTEDKPAYILAQDSTKIILQQLADYKRKDSIAQIELTALSATTDYWKSRQKETERNLYEILHLPAKSIPGNLDRYFTDYLNRYYGEPDSNSAILPAGPVNTNR